MKITEMLAQREHVHKRGVLCRRRIRSGPTNSACCGLPTAFLVI